MREDLIVILAGYTDDMCRKSGILISAENRELAIAEIIVAEDLGRPSAPVADITKE